MTETQRHTSYEWVTTLGRRSHAHSVACDSASVPHSSVKLHEALREELREVCAKDYVIDLNKSIS